MSDRDTRPATMEQADQMIANLRSQVSILFWQRELALTHKRIATRQLADVERQIEYFLRMYHPWTAVDKIQELIHNTKRFRLHDSTES